MTTFAGKRLMGKIIKGEREIRNWKFKKTNTRMSDEEIDRLIYDDKKLIKGVKQSMKEARQGKGRVFKTDKELDNYFKKL